MNSPIQPVAEYLLVKCITGWESRADGCQKVMCNTILTPAHSILQASQKASLSRESVLMSFSLQRLTMHFVL